MPSSVFTFLAGAGALSLIAVASTAWPLLRRWPDSPPGLTEPVTALDRPPATGGTPQPQRGLAAVLALAVPTLAVAVYALVGQPASWWADASEAATPLAVLEQRTRHQPQDAAAWQALALAQEADGQLAAAQTSWREVTRLRPQDPDAWLALAVSTAMGQPQGLAGEPEALIVRALSLAPDHVQALALAGSARYDQRDFAGAVAHWERLLPLVEAGSPLARSIEDSLARARAAGTRQP